MEIKQSSDASDKSSVEILPLSACTDCSSKMKPCPNPLIRIIIDDEDGELPSINISPQIDDDYDEEVEHHHRQRHGDTSSEDEEEDDGEEEEHHQDEHYGDSLSSSVDSFIQHLDSLHPFRFTEIRTILLIDVLVVPAGSSVSRSVCYGRPLCLVTNLRTNRD